LKLLSELGVAKQYFDNMAKNTINDAKQIPVSLCEGDRSRATAIEYLRQASVVESAISAEQSESHDWGTLVVPSMEDESLLKSFYEASSSVLGFNVDFVKWTSVYSYTQDDLDKLKIEREKARSLGVNVSGADA
jgi:hypothetical protein